MLAALPPCNARKPSESAVALEVLGFPADTTTPAVILTLSMHVLIKLLKADPAVQEETSGDGMQRTCGICCDCYPAQRAGAIAVRQLAAPLCFWLQSHSQSAGYLMKGVACRCHPCHGLYSRHHLIGVVSCPRGCQYL